MRCAPAWCLAAGILFVASCTTTRSTAADIETRIRYRMKDGQGQERVREGGADSAVLALWGDRHGKDFMEIWSPVLNDSLARTPGLQRLDFAHLKGVPFFIKGRIKKRFREDWEGVVLLDWDGEFRRAYACTADSCTAILFDRDGYPVRRWTVGALDPHLLADMTEAARQVASVDSLSNPQEPTRQ